MTLAAVRPDALIEDPPQTGKERARALFARLAELRDRGEPVILDLDRLEFIDSSGLRVLLQAVQDSRAGAWRFAPSRIPPPTMRRSPAT